MNTLKELYTAGKKQIALYLGWVILHISLLLVSGDAYNKTDIFYPFNMPEDIPFKMNDSFMVISHEKTYRWLDYYDYSEFFVYLLLPVLGLVMYNAFRKK